MEPTEQIIHCLSEMQILPSVYFGFPNLSTIMLLLLAGYLRNSILGRNIASRRMRKVWSFKYEVSNFRFTSIVQISITKAKSSDLVLL